MRANRKQDVSLGSGWTGHRPVWASLCVLMVGVMAGCQVPSYQLPRGYSSTYARHLRAAELGPPIPIDAPSSEVAADSRGVFYPQTFRYDPPTKSEFRQAVLVPDTPSQTRRRY